MLQFVTTPVSNCQRILGHGDGEFSTSWRDPAIWDMDAMFAAHGGHKSLMFHPKGLHRFLLIKWLRSRTLAGNMLSGIRAMTGTQNL
jgi:hypothetical protein